MNETSDEIYKGYTIRRRGLYKRQVQLDEGSQAVLFNRPRDAYRYIDEITEPPPEPEPDPEARKTKFKGKD